MEARPEIQTETGLLKNIIGWFFQAKATMFLIFLTIITTFYGWYFIGGMDIYELSLSNLQSGNYISLITNMFFHVDLQHLLSNMLFLLVFGRIAERQFDSIKMILLYLGSGIFAGLFSIGVQLLFNDYYSAIGASGAISGLIAAALLFKPFQLTYISFFPLPILAVGWSGIISDIVGGLGQIYRIVETPAVAYFSHIGGYLGMLVILFLIAREDRSSLIRGLFINFLIAGILIFLFYSPILSFI